METGKNGVLMHALLNRNTNWGILIKANAWANGEG